MNILTMTKELQELTGRRTFGSNTPQQVKVGTISFTVKKRKNKKVYVYQRTPRYTMNLFGEQVPEHDPSNYGIVDHDKMVKILKEEILR